MKLLMENWRGFLNEVTSVPNEAKTGFANAIAASKFWEQPNEPIDIDEVDGVDRALGTPATEALGKNLNQMAQELDTDLYFNVTSGDDAYVLGPDDPHGGYPNNWMMRGQYRGPYEELDGKHVVWMEFRPISEDFGLDKLNPNELVNNISTTLNHELVHYYQLKKQVESKGISDYDAFKEMVCDPEQTPVDDPDEYRETCGKEPPEQEGDEREVYLSRHSEVDAYAHEAAEQLLNKYSYEEALDAIRKMTPVDVDKYPEISSVVKDYGEDLKDNPEELNKFRKKLYQQIQKQAGIQEIFNNWRDYLSEAIELDIEVGDIVLGGKYKNKRIVVKDIGKDELGQPTINGKSILKFRMEKFLPDEKKSKKTLDAEKAEKEEEKKEE
jgi:tRNA isopentenyl-2-thiomethyl-A-37 hydroxylase MiaE